MLIALLVAFTIQAAQGGMKERGDGGAIEVAVKDPTDRADRDAIRSHLPHIAMMFGEGDFDAPMLVHDTKQVRALVAERFIELERQIDDLSRLREGMRLLLAEWDRRLARRAPGQPARLLDVLTSSDLLADVPDGRGRGVRRRV